MQQIYILRHGQSMANAQQLIAGQQESSLSKLGKRQAEEAAAAAAKKGIDLIVASPLQRTHQTAEIVARHLGYSEESIQVMPELIERYLGDLEGKHYDETRFGSGNTIEAEQASGVEPIGQLCERSKRALEIIHNLPGKNILAVCHNGTGRMLMNVAAGGEPLEMYSYPKLENAKVYSLH